ncbi:MAG: hypothetical protein J4224_00300 [Candidatus Diapherotrites archaeon]|uniref:HTH iclR-type domain-containing protein n=1 Tax=Candidatus Iainarchaeum sp. TaxID=3101447 RepID=A0A7J4IR56_9ARCH|nr:MAG: hypothetical protein QT03_C0001G0320 [archaeon GW2011_AR10]MBS3058850.1 hypothetical protein [Candidatus Diapherotrites archaeon]HIH07971.1 hypothetical protein [Candidatus Diapherotrites archaeon]
MVNLFLDFLGDNPTTRLLEFLITGREFDYSLTDMAKNAGIGWSTIHRILPRLIKQKIVVETREIGRAKLFKLNQKNEEVKKLIELYDGLLAKQLEQIKEKNLLVAAK